MAPAWADSAFDGIGASRTGGRWNSKGIRVVYLASSLALAALELLVHINYEQALNEHVAIPVDFDGRLLLELDSASLPVNWQTVDALALTQEIGDEWVRRGASPLLAVPSRVVPAETNYLFNPQHPDAGLVVPGRQQAFGLDPRLLRR